ncbi:histidine kinase [Vibrio sp. 10N.286.49.C2]|uniref:ATP-binding protein n=1 Tax=unclassified Vibrio TaxID=2614977 RepID=UPI000C84AACB|nr:MULTISPECIES: sensor histidine kinase [unclassified Vibrio]PMH31614.1 histidine kinase [Vibrio sp. 10N.286.49.C2]PMH50636.1 histidine kinase [Vibrio sp. 10N.286.49.B1]PMH79303.1 histidine kinase [Vibrio sp. 10N.286.48.B7]
MKWNQFSFRHRMLIIMTLSGLLQLVILSLAGFSYIKQSQEQEMGFKAQGVATFLAQSSSVISMIENRSSATRQHRFRGLTEMIGAAFIVIGDRDGIRLVHPIDERIGKPMKGGDNDKALVYGQSYVSFAEGSLGKSVRGKAAVFDADGNIIGVVSVGYLLDRLQDRIEPYLAFLLGMAALVLVANGIVSNYISRRFQKAILGFEPEEIGRLYSELDVTMSTIKEGVISIDSNGILRSINTSACDILQLDKQASLNQPLSHVLPNSDLHHLLDSQEVDHDIELYLNQRRIVANRGPILVDGKVVGAVSSFRLRDEINDLTDQLSQTKAYAEMLRSQTHEHRNKLNTINGMLQMGELSAVQHMIGQETAHYQSLIEFLRETIRDPLIAGMLLGKTERARELGLTLVVDPESRLEPMPAALNSDDLVTILGNLIDNAFDASLSAIQKMPNERELRATVEVSVSDFGNEIILEVVDKGCGLPTNLDVSSLTQRGVSSKSPSNRGVGLFLVKQLTERYQGQLELIANNDMGTRVTVYVPKDGLA